MNLLIKQKSLILELLHFREEAIINFNNGQEVQSVILSFH